MAMALVGALACSGGSPTAPRGVTVLGEWLANQSVSIPECGIEFTYDVTMSVAATEDASRVTVRVDYPGLGSCGLFGSATYATIDVSEYGCFRFGYSCTGHLVECSDGRHLSVCDLVTWSTLRATLLAEEGWGTAAASVPVVEPATGELQAELGTDVSVVFHRIRR